MDLAYEQGRSRSRHAAEVESTIFRLVQESLTNVVKHAEAEHVEIEVSEADGRIAVCVHDDGRGFYPARPGEGFGLLGMRERVSLLGGDLNVESTAGAGTTVTASVPATLRRRRTAGTAPDRPSGLGGPAVGPDCGGAAAAPGSYQRPAADAPAVDMNLHVHAVGKEPSSPPGARRGRARGSAPPPCRAATTAPPPRPASPRRALPKPRTSYTGAPHR